MQGNLVAYVWKPLGEELSAAWTLSYRIKGLKKQEAYENVYRVEKTHKQEQLKNVQLGLNKGKRKDD